MSSMIVGTLAGAFVIGSLPQVFFFQLLTAVCALGSFFFLALPDPIENDDCFNVHTPEETEQSTNALELFKDRNMQLFQPIILYSSIDIGIDAGVIAILVTNTMKSTEESKDWSEA